MAKLPGDKFLDLLQRSDLVDAKALEKSLAEFLTKHGQDALTDGDLLAEHFINAGLITGWQRDKLMEGRHKGFFVGKYKLHSLLGAGGMSHVYLAEHRQMRRRVAIKVLPKSKANSSSYLERFQVEARVSARLEHPNIVRAYDVDFDQEQNVHYLVMEYVQGRDLQVTVKQRGPLPYVEAAEYIRQTAIGLSIAHQQGIVHRDIKPANLLIDIKGTVKILDMGLARFDEDEAEKASLTQSHEENVLGTADYLAPEQAINSHSVDARADIYSLGCTLYYTLTGQPPFPEGTIAQRLMKHQKEEPASILKKRPDCPPELIDICRKMMAKKAAVRYQSADEVVKALADFIAAQSDSGVLTAAEGARLGGSDSNLSRRGGGSSGGVGALSGDGVDPNGSATQDTAPNLMPTIDTTGSKKGMKPTASAVDAGPVVNVHDAATLPEMRVGASAPSAKGTGAIPVPKKKKKKGNSAKTGQWIIIVGIVLMIVIFLAVVLPFLLKAIEENRLLEEERRKKQEQKTLLNMAEPIDRQHLGPAVGNTLL